MKNPAPLLRYVLPLFLILFVALTAGGISADSTGASSGSEQTKTSATKETSPLTATMQRYLADRAASGNAGRATEAVSALTPCTNGTAGIYPCRNVDLLSVLPVTSMGGVSDANDIWGWTDPVTDIEWALVGLTNGTAFVSLEDPETPVVAGRLPTHTSNSDWRDVKVYANHAYIVSEAGGHGMQVFDLTQLRSANPVNFPITFSNTAHFSAFGNAHNIVINEDSGYAYAVGANTCSGGLQMINLATPDSPSNAGCFSADGYTHDAQCVNYSGPDSDHVGKEICLNSNEDTLTIVDVSNKATPVQLDREGYAGSEYAHQGWLTEDQAYFLLGDELDEDRNGHSTRTYVWDVRDLDNIKLIGVHNAATAAIDHNLYTLDGLTYQSNYRAGVRIFDNRDVVNGNISEVGFFDVFPSSDSASFNGTWSNYPYFESGIVIASSIEGGLFVLQPNGFVTTATNDTFEACNGASASTTLSATVLGLSIDNITFTQTGLPNEAASFSVNPITPDSSSVLSIDSSLLSGAGNYLFTVTGSDGSKTSSIDMKVIGQAPGAVAIVSPLSGAISVAQSTTLQWVGGSFADSYLVEVATDPTFQNIIDTAIKTGTSHSVANLAENTAYYWRVTAQNVCGSGPSLPAAFVTFAGTSSCTANFGPEDFEAGTGGLSVAGSSVGSTWSVRTTQANSGSRAWFGDDVSQVSDQRLGSPAIVIPPTAAQARLYFATWYDLELDNDDAYDGGILEISTNNGTTFTQVPNEDLLTVPYDDDISSSFSSPISGRDAWTGSQTTWREAKVDLDDYIGSTIQLRWRLATDVSVSDVGWAIDDVRVESCEGISADYSDLPASYGAAWHTGDGTLRIGSAWDSDDTFADAQDNATDDVTVGAVAPSAATSVSFDVSGDGWVQAWFDWDGNGTFEASEQVHNAAVSAGAVSIPITAPASLASTIAYRIRLFDSSVDPDSARAPTAQAVGGEIEDGVTTNSTTTAVAMQQPTAVPNNTAVWLIAILVLTTGLALTLRRRQ